ncbi:unnamed protein product [Nesidiocoris tenuis]|uniref:Uncharacterized protein n=1 Tax=Nesidiocoris tenuis TaxID=355587 RepID=A0A6H5G7B3_9HEMI|nr:unnamed protein product [Nesidiocoris tenuis]
METILEIKSSLYVIYWLHLSHTNADAHHVTDRLPGRSSRIRIIIRIWVRIRVRLRIRIDIRIMITIRVRTIVRLNRTWRKWNRPRREPLRISGKSAIRTDFFATQGYVPITSSWMSTGGSNIWKSLGMLVGGISNSPKPHRFVQNRSTGLHPLRYSPRLGHPIYSRRVKLLIDFSHFSKYLHGLDAVGFASGHFRTSTPSRATRMILKSISYSCYG